MKSANPNMCMHKFISRKVNVKTYKHIAVIAGRLMMDATKFHIISWWLSLCFISIYVYPSFLYFVWIRKANNRFIVISI